MEKTKCAPNVGEFFTVEREVNASTGLNYFLTRLEGGLILVDVFVEPSTDPCLIGGSQKKKFIFKCVQAGEAAIQFSYSYASAPEVLIYEEVLPFEIDAPNANMPDGGWTPFRDLTEEDRKVFNEALEGLVGVGYHPKQVSTQVVAGRNYRFICEAITVTREPEKFKALVTIFQPLPGQGKPYITDIRRM